MSNSSKFFANKDCEYYPCHKMEGDLNCLFCYCPLYHLEDCPGNPTYKDKNGDDQEIRVNYVLKSSKHDDQAGIANGIFYLSTTALASPVNGADFTDNQPLQPLPVRKVLPSGIGCVAASSV